MSDAPVKDLSFAVKDGLLTNRDYLSFLERLHLDTLNNVMRYVGGALIAQRGRTTVVRVETEHGSLYLNRHAARPVRDLLRTLRRFQRVDRNRMRGNEKLAERIAYIRTHILSGR